MDKFLNYFDSRRREAILSRPSSDDGPVITISRQTGCDARQVAESVVYKLNQRAGKNRWRWVDKDIIYAIAKELNTDTQRVENFYEGLSLSNMSEMIMAFSGGFVSDMRVKKAIRDVVLSICKEGYIVLVGRGGVAITRNIVDSLHIRLLAPFYWRVCNVMKKKEITVGLFNYPILMSADILLYNADIIPVGKDQKQHIEMARDIAEKFNNTFGETFKMPEALIKKEVEIVPGTDGLKMSKSYKNTIDIFEEESVIKKQIMGIKTDSKAVEEQKNPEECNVFKIYKLIASEEKTKTMAEKYKKGGFGYGDAKKELLKEILEYFKEARLKYNEIHKNKEYVLKTLESGAIKARKIAEKTIEEVEKKVGFKY